MSDTSISIADLILSEAKAKFKNSIGQFSTGVCLLSVRTMNDPGIIGRGFIINSLASLSLDPLMVNFAIKTDSYFLKILLGAKFFDIHILSQKQKDLSQYFAKNPCSYIEAKLVQSFDDSHMLLNGSCASLSCAVEQDMIIGDHVLVVGKVLDAHSSNGEPLVYYNRDYRSLSKPQKVTKSC